MPTIIWIKTHEAFSIRTYLVYGFNVIRAHCNAAEVTCVNALSKHWVCLVDIVCIGIGNSWFYPVSPIYITKKWAWSFVSFCFKLRIVKPILKNRGVSCCFLFAFVASTTTVNILRFAIWWANPFKSRWRFNRILHKHKRTWPIRLISYDLTLTWSTMYKNWHIIND